MIIEYDASKEKCPLPLVKMRLMLKKLQINDSCVIKIADEGSKTDIPKYLNSKGYQFTQHSINSSVVELRIKTGKLI